MPRDEYDDRDDDRRRRDFDRDDDQPRRRRRPDPDDRDYDRTPRKSNIGLILLIVGLVVGLPILACGGFAVWGFFVAKKGFDQFQVMFGGEMAAQSFLHTLEGGNTQLAYDMTSANFRTNTTKQQFEDLVKANPVLTSANTTNQSGFPSPTGTAPNRKIVLTFTINPGHSVNEFEPDKDDPGFKPKVEKPKNVPVNPNAKAIVCTLTVAEQPDGIWKVDGLTIP